MSAAPGLRVPGAAQKIWRAQIRKGCRNSSVPGGSFCRYGYRDTLASVCNNPYGIPPGQARQDLGVPGYPALTGHVL
eukprot:951684-Rhodomonas_salina.1